MCDSDLLEANSSEENYEWMGSGWYRIAGEAGTMIPETPQGTNTCGTSAPGYMNDVHPTGLYQTEDVQYCFEWNSNDCNWETAGKVTNCGSYYVYYLEDTTQCNTRYCGFTPV